MGLVKQRLLGAAIMFTAPWIWTFVGSMLPPCYFFASYISAAGQLILGLIVTISAGE